MVFEHQPLEAHGEVAGIPTKIMETVQTNVYIWQQCVDV